jgi:serine/threonine-protein kinase
MTRSRWQRVEELFHEAGAQAPDRRDAFLDRACAGDSDLRRDVVSLLQQPEGSWLRDGLPALASSVMAPPPDLEGRALGTYVLGPLIGRGGMGDVYRARDGKLGRDVAIKLLSGVHLDDPGRRERSEREARILAALNHPNIAAIYGLEESDGLRGLVLELVEGVTLKDRLAEAGRLAPDEAVAIARQIANALEAAHQKGVVHRDLKPANVKIAPGGLVKVLDFGLAKIETAEGAEPAGLSVLATNDGVLLGTIAYMSPEQARGASVDKRSDIWAFGCVLYEMLSGGRAFRGDSAADVLGAITTHEPDFDRLPSETPRQVRRVLRRCLTKDLARRYHDIADARIELDEVDDTAAPPAALRYSNTSARGTPAARRWTAIGLLTGTVLAIAAAVAVWRPFATTSATPPRTAAHVAIPLPADVALYNIGRGSSVAVSPDGQRILYVGLAGGRRQLYLRRLSDSTSTRIPGTENAVSPFFSPDGRWIGFINANPGGSVMKILVDGGTAVAVVPSQSDGAGGFAVQSATWPDNDSIVFAAINPAARGLWRVPAGGGTAVRLTTPRADEGNHLWPQVLPSGRAVIYTAWNNTGFAGGRVIVESLGSGERKTLVERASYARVVSTPEYGSWLVYARPEGLYASPFDLETLTAGSQATPVVDGVATNLSGGAHYGVSPNGLLAYVPGGLDELDKTAVWVDRTGRVQELGLVPGLGFSYRLSPDGRRLARPGATGASRDLWIDDLVRRGTPVRLTASGSIGNVCWTPDGQRVIYAYGAPVTNLYMRAADGSGSEERLTRSTQTQGAGSVSADGQLLVYFELSPENLTDLWLLPLTGRREPRRLLATPFAELNPVFSPDGRWVAYRSNMSGKRFEIYLTPVAGGGRQYPVSAGGGQAPLWSHDGRELYYRDRDPATGGNMMAVSIDLTGPEPRIGTPRVLFPSPYQGDGDVTADGRFLLLKPTPEESRSRTIELVMNWFDDLQARMPR